MLSLGLCFMETLSSAQAPVCKPDNYAPDGDDPAVDVSSGHVQIPFGSLCSENPNTIRGICQIKNGGRDGRRAIISWAAAEPWPTRRPPAQATHNPANGESPPATAFR